MKLTGGIALATVGIALIVVPTAEAAATRAEYVAQVDPICKSFESPLATSFATYSADYKRLLRTAKKGRIKAFVRAARATAAALNVLSGLHTNLAAQIQTVPPPTADAAVVFTWLNALRQEGSLATAAATALLHAKFKAFNSYLGQADAALAAGKNAIAGFGFATCGVTVLMATG
jgi:hypothetical protein